MKWHKTFYITEEKIPKLLGKYFEVEDSGISDKRGVQIRKIDAILDKKDFLEIIRIF